MAASLSFCQDHFSTYDQIAQQRHPRAISALSDKVNFWIPFRVVSQFHKDMTLIFVAF